MTVNEEIIRAATRVVSVCVPGVYDGEAEEYCTFNVSQIPDAFGDDAPDVMRSLVQLHYHCPWSMDSLAARQSLWGSILEEDFTAPEVTEASDETGQHFVFEFEVLGGA